MAAGIYIHIPFCIRKCFYCDFYSKPIDDRDMRKEYTRALLQEISFYGKKYGKNFKADSIFFGGGTPSLMEDDLIHKIIDALKKSFDIAEDCEITMECNPATMTLEKLEGYKRAGVNRLSIGAQSFKDELLEKLGRIHKGDDVRSTIRLARKAGFRNISLDLMFAIPGLEPITWRKTVRAAVGTKATHISFYSLEIAEGTEFGRLYKTGMLKETPIFIDRKMYHDAIKILEKKEFNHYEISNMARPGYECRHNMKYWTFEDYLGLGASSHGFIKGVRYSNVSDVEGYIDQLHNQDFSVEKTLGKEGVYGAACVDSFYVNSYEDNVSEYVFTALRTKAGVNFKDFKEKMKNDFWDVFGAQRNQFENFVKEGYAISDDEHIALTQMGMDISNKIMALFV